MELLLIGTISKTFGLVGQCKVISHTSYPKLRYKKGEEYFLRRGDALVPVHLSTFKDAGGTYIVSFQEAKTIEEIEPYIGFDIVMDKEKAPMPEGEYRFSDLVGCKVKDQDGNLLGQISDVLDYAPKKTLRVKREGKKDFFVPFVDDFVGEIDLENKIVHIKVVEGML